MNEPSVEKLWISKLLESEQIQTNPDTYSEKKNTEINTIIFLGEQVDDQVLGFLNKILQSCDIHTNKYYISYISIPFKQIKNAYPAIENVFVFGLDTKKLNINIKIDVMDACRLNDIRLISCVPLNVLMEDVPSKNYFWNHILKPNFLMSK